MNAFKVYQQIKIRYEKAVGKRDKYFSARGQNGNSEAWAYWRGKVKAYKNAMDLVKESAWEKKKTPAAQDKE